MGLSAQCEVDHRPPDRDRPFWVGCGAVLEGGGTCGIPQIGNLVRMKLPSGRDEH